MTACLSACTPESARARRQIRAAIRRRAANILRHRRLPRQVAIEDFLQHQYELVALRECAQLSVDALGAAVAEAAACVPDLLELLPELGRWAQVLLRTHPVDE